MSGLKLWILTLFPEFLESYFRTSIMGRAIRDGTVAVSIVDIREFAMDRHRSVDDAPYGGGAGMVLMPEPLAAALDSVDAASKKCIYPTPSGKRFTQETAERLSRESELVFLCGRYEGIDQRIIDEYVDEELTIGDYVLSSGELAALVIVDAVFRLRDGVISRESLREESFQDGLLEYPLYTRPEVFRGRSVPEVLLSGHHRLIDEWRKKERAEKTVRNRPDLLEEES